MKKKIRVVQFGVTHEHAIGKLDTIRALADEFEIVGVVDDRASASPRWPVNVPDSAFGGLRVMTEDELWAESGSVDAVFVETTNADLVATAGRVLEHGLPMHMDKPGGESYAPYERLRREAARRGLPLQMGYMFRGNPAVRWLVDAVRRGWFGDVFRVSADMDHGYGDDAYRRYIGTFRGGMLYNLGSHLADIVVSMLGEPVSAQTAIADAPNSAPGSRDNCAALLQYANGAIVHLRACGRSVSGIGRRRISVCGTRGSAELRPIERFDGRPLTVEVQFSHGDSGLPAGRAQTLDFGPQGRDSHVDRYAAQLRLFARMVRGEEAEPPELCEHDLAVQRTILRMCGIS